MNELLTYFEYEHLPAHLQTISKLFYTLAHELTNTLPDNRMADTALFRLLEAKDCAVRAALSTIDTPTD